MPHYKLLRRGTKRWKQRKVRLLNTGLYLPFFVLVVSSNNLFTNCSKVRGSPFRTFSTFQMSQLFRLVKLGFLEPTQANAYTVDYIKNFIHIFNSNQIAFASTMDTAIRRLASLPAELLSFPPPSPPAAPSSLLVLVPGKVLIHVASFAICSSCSCR